MFVLGHLMANYMAVKSLVFSTFNLNRFRILTRNYFENGTIWSTEKVNQLEPVLCKTKRVLDLKMGDTIAYFKKPSAIDLDKFKKEKFHIEFDIKSKF
jgi:hypothetical protein